MRASDILTSDVLSVEEHTSLQDAIELLQQQSIRHLPVLGSSGDLVGMLSEADIRSGNTPFTMLPVNLEQPQQQVVDLMSSDVVTVHPQTSVGEIIDLMLEHRIGAVPVVEPSHGTLVGIVSYVDVLRALR